MTAFGRSDTSVLGRWWWTLDRWTLAALLILIGIGIVLVMAASPPVAHRLGLDSFALARKQLMFLLPAILLLVGASILSPRGIRRLAFLGFVITLILLVITLVAGIEIKGARRWIHFAGLSLQPSEFIKPTFAVLTGWLFARYKINQDTACLFAAGGLFALVALMMVLQPDIGMLIVVSAVWMMQLFVAGLKWRWVAAGILVAVVGGILAYGTLDHVRSRIDRFLDPSTGDRFQISRSLDAFMDGGLAGRGPGEGRVKEILPDAHADFIFAVAGEEFGLFACLVLVALFAFVVLRGMGRMMHEDNLFVMLAVAGLLTQFGLQALINMGSTLDLLPTKGMTLPFLSYGGSSLLALALGMGMMLALTRRRASGEIP